MAARGLDKGLAVAAIVYYCSVPEDRRNSGGRDPGPAPAEELWTVQDSCHGGFEGAGPAGSALGDLTWSAWFQPDSAEARPGRARLSIIKGGPREF